MIVPSPSIDGAISATRAAEAQEGAANGSNLLGPGRDRPTFLRWSVCAAIAILAHGAIAARMLYWQAQPDAMAPTATIVIELSPVVTVPEVLDKDTPPAPDLVQADSPSDKVVEKDIEERQIAVEETFEPELVDPELEPTPERVPLQPREARQEVEIQAVETTSQTAPVVVIEQKSEAELAPPPKPNDDKEIDAPRSAPADARPHPRTVQPKPVKPAPNEPQKQAPDHTISKRQAAQVRQAAAQAPAVSAPSNSNALPNWKSQIVGILERNKHSLESHDHGISTLAFSLNRQGRVTSARITASSGSATLDAETLALVRRSQPFPPPPPEVPGAQIGLVVPVLYR
jgi:periplasmic protein TonB